MRGHISTMKVIKAYKFLDCSLIKVCGEKAYRFFGVCVSLDALLYEMNLHSQENSVNEYYIYVKNKDIPKLKEASIKTGINFEIIKEYGLIAYIRKYFSRKMFFISISIGILLLYALTLFVWQIQISGCVNRNEAEILEVVNDAGAYYGILKGKCDCEAIEEAIRNEFDDVLWVSASIKGTGLFVQIKENTYLNDKMAISEETADLTADSNGTVVSIVTRTGVPQVGIGSEVKTGDILISGVEEFHNDAAEVYKTEHVFADGDVIVESSNSYTWKYRRNIKVRSFVKNKKGISIKFFDRQIINIQPKIKDNKYEVMEKNKVVVVGEDFYLPVSVKNSDYKIYETKEVMLSDESMRIYAGIMYKMFCIREESKGVDIIEKNATIEFNDSYCIVSANMKTRRKCGIHTAITVEPIEEKAEEEVVD